MPTKRNDTYFYMQNYSKIVPSAKVKAGGKRERGGREPQTSSISI